ncbi:MAG: hypothetical protein HOB03_03675 [Gammaproteobacteria bacterium]|jgi:outer membrane PBP1 activator LpoA protein|nr:hypothetical protein [Gammaproteobacteria bacterium]
MTLLKLLLGVLLILSSPLLQAVCSPDQEPITVVLLLPLAEGSTPFGQSLLDGFIAADDEVVDSACEVNLRYLNTEEESTTFIQQWYRALELEPELLIGPLLEQHQQQLVDLSVIELPENTTWLYPGEPTHLPVSQSEQLLTFSISWREQLRNLLEYGWDQGQHDIVLLLPDSDLGRKIADATVLVWETKGGVVTAVAHYGKRFSTLNQAMRQLIRESRGSFDVLLTLANDQQLRMLRPLMSYHSREEPIYSLMPPVGERGLKKDLQEIYFPMHPALLERSDPGFEVDDFLLQVENVGFDLMMLTRTGEWQQLQKKGSYLGRSGRYTIEDRQLIRTFCIAVSDKKRPVLHWCPQSEEIQEFGL